MSVRSLISLAAARDKGTPTKAKRKAVPRGGGRAVESDSKEQTPVTAGDALVSAIPTEPLALYTGLVSAIVALFSEGTESTERYVPLRWWMFALAIVFVLLWVVGGYFSTVDKADRKRSFPLAESVAAAAAFAAWGLVMPESPLRTQLDGTTEAVVTLCITFGGAALIYLFAQFGLTKMTKK